MLPSLVFSYIPPSPPVTPPLDYTFAPSEQIKAHFAGQTPNPAAVLSPSRIKALQTLPDQALNAFLEELFVALSGGSAADFSNGSTCTGDTLADISWLLRTLMPEAASTEFVGITTGENLFRGAWAAFKAWKRFQAAEVIGDKGGMIEGGIDALRGGLQSAGGGFYLAYRGLMAAADINKVNAGFNATTPLGKAAFSTGTIGNIFFTGFYAAISVWSAYELYESMKFGQNLDKADDDLVAFLEKKALAKPNLNAENCSSDALNAMTDVLFAQMEASKPQGEASVSKDEVKQFLENLFALKQEQFKRSNTFIEMAHSQALRPEEIDKFNLVSFMLENLKRQKRKDAKLSRVVGGAAPVIKKAFERGLEPRLASTNPLIIESAKNELTDLKAEATSEKTKAYVVYGVLLAVGVLGLASSGIGFLPVLGAAAGTALIVVTLLLCLSMLGADGYFMLKGWGSGKPGTYDKHYIVFLSVMIVTILAISIGTTLGFGLPIFPLIFAGVFGFVGLGLCGVALDELIYKEKKWKAEHPDLEAFQKTFASIESSPDATVDEKMTLLFKMLPKSDRHALRTKYFEMSKDGKLPFINKYYQALNIMHDFGGAYLNAQTSPNAMTNENEHKLLLRGVKKTVNFYWKKWAIERTETSKLIALEAQALFEAVKRKNSEAIKAAMINIGNKGHYAQLKADLWYVVKREESKKDLMRIVKIVSDEQKPLAGAQQKAPALCAHAIDILKSA